MDAERARWGPSPRVHGGLLIAALVGLTSVARAQTAEPNAAPNAASTPNETRAEPNAASVDDFVRVVDGHFVAGDAPFRFVGANVAVTHSAAHRAALEATLDAVVADGGRVVRVWALGEAPVDAPAWRRDYALRLGPEGWVEDSFAHLDRVLVAARARGLRVVMVLANRWADYGGFSEVARWAGAAPVGRDLSPAELARFFECQACDAHYVAHVRRVVGRVNAENGVAYRDDPTVIAWELANEVGATSVAAERALLAWVRRHAALVHELAPRQLVSAGHVGWRTERDREVWRAVQAVDGIDYADLHAYPRRDSRVRQPRDLVRWLDARVSDARAIGKPLVIGELGFATNEPGAARWLGAFLGHARRVGVDGVLLWIYRVSGYADPYALHFDEPSHARAIRRAFARYARSSLPRRLAPLSGAAATPWLAVCPGRPAVARPDPDGNVTVEPGTFVRARFESCGVHAQEGTPEEHHLWGAGEGHVEWRFRVARRGRYRFEATLSTELPGLGGGGPEDVGHVRVRVDGELATEVALQPDDGRGRSESLPLGELSPGVHRVRLETVERPGRGLAVYAREPMVVRAVDVASE
ncbi:MAG: cellulase family glycosylhydrolase [Sandaracinus sp.]|nr:cellulase family glycosylhydrolase [Sandaracinus sp.]